MFSEGIIRMYAEQPDMFWLLILAIAPGFIMGVLVGLYEGSREACGKTSSGWRQSKQQLAITGITLAWTWFLSPSWFPTENMTVLAILVAITLLVLQFPIIGGCMTGLRTFAFLWWLIRMWHAYVRPPRGSV